ncbi:MAG: response regulator [Candidatus Omnitrophota bacterium]
MQKKILVVDDDEGFQELLKVRLGNAGYQVIIASDGVDGVCCAQEERPDLILMDAIMPNLNGYMAVKELQAKKETAAIPIIILSARENIEEIFSTEGIKDYIHKPFESEELLSKIKKYLNA